MNKKFPKIFIVAGAIIILLIGGFFVWQNFGMQKPVACTMEAKVCPDGSAVGREGPDCEFTECPAINPAETAGWKTYIDYQYRFEFKYPEKFGANVWRPLFWPATTTVVSINEDPLAKGCPDFPAGIQGAAQEPLKINNIDWTLYTGAEGAAGSSYINYCYVAERNNNYYVVSFEIRTTNGCGSNCGPYCQTQYEAECINFNLAKDVEKPIETIVSTFKFLDQ
jgi:hypothetical protein